MALPLTTDAPRHRSASERLAAKLGGEHRLRQFEAAFADALERGGPVHIEADSIAGDAPLMRAPLILQGKRAW